MRLTTKKVLFVLSHPHVIAIVIALIGSLIFLSLPGFNDLLYVQERLNISRVTANEWIWTAVSTAWIILVFRLPSREIQYMITENATFIFFLISNLLWIFFPLYQYTREHAADAPFSVKRIVEVVGGKAAWPALWNVAIVCFPVQRTSPILEAIGLSSKQAVPFHIWAANATLLWLLVHTVLLSLVYVWRTESLSGWLALMIPYKIYYTEGVVNFMGWVGLTFFLGIWVTSLPFVQRKSHEAFRILHWIFSALFLLGSNLHDYNTWFFIQPAMIMMVADFILRRYSNLSFEESVEQSTSNINRQEGKVKFSTTGDIASLTFPIPNSWSTMEPGMHVFLTVESISRWQSHPYSISSMNQHERTFTIHVKALGDWSTDFVSAAQDACNSPLVNSSSSWEIEGPYGSSALYKTIQSCKHCIFLAGGVGITGVSALAEARCRRRRRTDIGEDQRQETESEDDQSTTMLWMVQTAAEANFLVPLLRDCNDNNICDNAHVWITKQEESVALCENSEEDGHTMLTSTTSRKARWKLGFQWQKGIVLFASILSSVLVMVISRFICAMQPAKNSVRHVREYSFLWHSTTCASCDIEDIESEDRDNQIPCCTVPITHCCFRGVPMILSFLLMPPLTLLLARALNALWLRSCGRSFFGYASITNHGSESHCVSNGDDGEDLRGLEIPQRGSTNVSETTRDGSGKLEYHWGGRPDNISTLFSSRYLGSRLFSSGNTNPEDVILVMCGPQKLVENTKRELAKDPLRRHWRVALAS